MNEESTTTEENAEGSQESGDATSEELAADAEHADTSPEVQATEASHPKARRQMMSPAAKKMLMSLLVMAGAALIVVGSLLPWLSGDTDSETTVIGNLAEGYGLLALIFGLALFASILRKKGPCTHSYLAFGALWAVIAFVLGPNRDEAAGVWLALAGAALVLVVIEYQDIKEMLHKARGKTSEESSEHEETEEPAEDAAAINKRAANAGLAFLAGLGAMLSTFLWDWVNLGRNTAQSILLNVQGLLGDTGLQGLLGDNGIQGLLGTLGGDQITNLLGAIGGDQISNLLEDVVGGSERLSGFDEPLTMVLVIFGFSILVLVGALVSLQERSFSKPMPGLFRVIRMSWVLAGIAICTVSGGVLLGNLFWNDLTGGSLREGPFIAFLSGILLLCASRSEWAEPECEVSQTNSKT